MVESVTDFHDSNPTYETANLGMVYPTSKSRDDLGPVLCEVYCLWSDAKYIL